MNKTLSEKVGWTDVANPDLVSALYRTNERHQPRGHIRHTTDYSKTSQELVNANSDGVRWGALLRHSKRGRTCEVLMQGLTASLASLMELNRAGSGSPGRAGRTPRVPADKSRREGWHVLECRGSHWDTKWLCAARLLNEWQPRCEPWKCLLSSLTNVKSAGSRHQTAEKSNIRRLVTPENTY